MRGSLNQPVTDFLPFTVKINFYFFINTEIHISEKLFMFIFVQQLQIKLENFPEKVEKIQCAYLENGKIHIDVWNTVNFNSCPDFAWSERDLSAIKNELKASRIVDNGPRYWVNDKVESLDENPDKGFEVRQFGDILMAKVATLERSFSSGMLSFENFYTPNTVKRNTRYTYFSDDWVFTLTDPDGQVYVMQSFSQQVNPDLTYENLHHLEDVLKLPKGWSYEPVLLEEELILESHGETTVVSDDFRNVYQIVPGGF